MASRRNWEEIDAVRSMLLRIFLPAWFVPAIVDWYFHRKTKIEDTSGARESLAHGLMFASVGVPVTLALLFQVDEFILAASAAAALAHEALTLYDVAYASERRYTGPSEQHVHSFLEVMPIAGAVLIFATHPEPARSLATRPWTALFPRLRRKPKPVPPAYLAAFFAAAAACIVAPYAEEFVRCYRAHPTLRERPIPPQNDPQ